ncbi:MAG: transcriptional regulator [Lentisphaerae bacterium]|jgi:TrpR family trp operon transcriptional repressor|nr:transcriptional regulator [Lentisphaerota bacterium]
MPQEKKIAPLARELAEIISRISDRSELEIFLQGLLTPSEIEEIQRRWKLLTALAEGHTQRAISSNLGISLGKIARGSRLMKYGDERFVQTVQRIHDEMRK